MSAERHYGAVPEVPTEPPMPSPMSPRTVRGDFAAILFDIDGTLVDSTPAVERSWRTWAGARGMDADEILRQSHGRRSEDTIAELLPVGERVAAVQELLALELTDLEGVVALPNAASLLASLPVNRWAAVTSGSRELMRARLSTAGLALPSVLVTGEDVTTGKPDPEGYLAAAAALGVDPAACLVVEDAPAGITSGRASGAFVVAVATSHPRQALTDADVVIDDLGACRVTPTDSGLHVTVAVAGAP